MNLIIAPQIEGIESYTPVKQQDMYDIISKELSMLKFKCLTEDFIMHKKFNVDSLTCFTSRDISTIKRFKYELYDGYSKELETSTYVKSDLSKAERTTKSIDDMTDKEYTAYMQRVLDKKLDLGIRTIAEFADTLVYLYLSKKGYEYIKLTNKDYKMCKAVALVNLDNDLSRYFIEGEDVTREEFYDYSISGL